MREGGKNMKKNETLYLYLIKLSREKKKIGQISAKVIGGDEIKTTFDLSKEVNIKKAKKHSWINVLLSPEMNLFFF